MLCFMCNINELVMATEIHRGFCNECQGEIRTVFDKDAFALGQYKDGINNLDWTNYLDKEDY